MQEASSLDPVQARNNTASNEPMGMNGSAFECFMAFYPLMMSFGFGGSLFGALWWAWDVAKEKVMRLFICSVEIRWDDDVFKWVNAYMVVKGYVKQ
jgi:hypothetical protein